MNFESDMVSLMIIPADGEVEMEHHLMSINVSRETVGLMAKDMLNVPLTLMTECGVHYDTVEVVVYHLGQDGRLPLNLRATVALQKAFGLPHEWEGDIVIAFHPTELLA